MTYRTLFDKLWERHVVADGVDGNQLIYIDRAILHEGGGLALASLSSRGIRARNPGQALAVTDHFVPSRESPGGYAPYVQNAISLLQEECGVHGVEFLGPCHERQGIVHVIAPELGFALPGLFIVCIDSHTSTNGALGGVGFGIGTTEMAHVIATQCLWQRRPRTMRIEITGSLPPFLSAKDVALAIIGEIGTAGATGYAVEFTGEAVRAMSMEARMTLCNLAIEAGARFGVVAPDQVTFDWIRGRPLAPSGAMWDAAVESWRDLQSDAEAVFDRVVELSIATLSPQVTWGTSPEDVLAIEVAIPADARAGEGDRKFQYMGLQKGARIAGTPIDQVFIGSCTNSRIEDLRAAAAILKGRRAVVPGLVVAGSQAIKRQAEEEGLAKIFMDAGLDWGLPGCSMCTALNGEGAPPGARIASTSNRNFEGRQGRDVRTHLMSPAMAAAAALYGRIVDVRHLAEAPA